MALTQVKELLKSQNIINQSKLTQGLVNYIKNPDPITSYYNLGSAYGITESSHNGSFSYLISAWKHVPAPQEWLRSNL